MSSPAAAVILAFPTARRRGLVRALAEQMANRSADEAERHLRLQLHRQTLVLRRRQLADDVVERQVHTLEQAVRAELWRRVLMPPLPSGAA